ncbi:MAG TPA: transcriptional regulator [Geothrix sp.]|nr:transcriptional regulator [Geothrix sp.]
MPNKEPDLHPILDLDRMVHEPARLAILTVLASAEEVAFLFLQRVTGLSKGNLSSHTQKLEAAGYLETVKGFQGRIPVTSFRITQDGLTALHAYHKLLRALLPKEGKP